VVPSFSSRRFSAASTLAHPVETKPICFLARYGRTSICTSSALRQPTATHGFDGVNENFSPSPTTMICVPFGKPARSSYAALMPPIPAPSTTTLAIAPPRACADHQILLH
jgi:hypothetical protein